MFIVDDVAFIRREHGHAIAAELERRGVRKSYYLETRADVLLRHTEVFSAGSGSASTTCSWAWRRWTPKGWSCSASG